MAILETNLASPPQTQRRPDPGLLKDLVSRILAASEPLRIVLFGSAARGEMTAHSDLDVLVVVRDGSRCREIAKRLYRQFRGLGRATDVVVVEERDVEQHGRNPFMIIHTALAEGIELYRAAS